MPEICLEGCMDIKVTAEVAGVEGGGLMFNVVLLQGMTISLAARKLHLVDDE